VGPCAKTKCTLRMGSSSMDFFNYYFISLCCTAVACASPVADTRLGWLSHNSSTGQQLRLIVIYLFVSATAASCLGASSYVRM